MPVPTRKSAGQTLDPNWASSSSHPCHSLAGHIKGLFLVPTSGAPYDVSGLNTLTVDASPTNDGFAGHVDNAAPLNALKGIVQDFTLLAVGVVISASAQYGVLAGWRGEEPVPQVFSGFVGHVYNTDPSIWMAARQTSGSNLQFSQQQLFSGGSTYPSAVYVGSWLSSGTYSGKIEGLPLTSGTWTPPPAMAMSGMPESAAQLAAISTWIFGSPPDAANREIRAEYVLVFDAPATEVQMDYLAAHPDEMLMAMSAGTGSGGGTGGGTTTAAPAPSEERVIPPNGEMLKDKNGVIVTDATFTVMSFQTCGTDAAIPQSSLSFDSHGYGAYCCTYDIQTYGPGHLIIMPVSAGHTFDPIQILWQYTISDGDLISVGAACVDALNSASAVLSAATTILATTQQLGSMIESSGAAKRFASDALANVISQLQPAAAAAITAADLTAGGTAPTVAQIAAGILASPSHLLVTDINGSVTASNVISGGSVTGPITLSANDELELAAAAANTPSATIAAMKTDPILSRTFNRTHGAYTYDQVTHVMTLLNDDGSIYTTVTLTYNGGTIVGKL